ncbi:adhesin [Pseudomonas sp. FME51]|uniref:adhesin n=1 Tax=Pseudomonas sp. FME51 TaxID=2742609 RepID=UPI001866F59C|nr:adhesin [Pseudomonas sp. FME51]
MALHMIVGLGLLLAAGAHAAENTATIDSSAAGYQGVLMVNQASGNLQQQVNARAVSAGAFPTLDVEQHRDGVLSTDAAVDLGAHIRGASFSGGSGVLGVNQGAGAGNQQINGFRLGAAARPESLDDQVLAQSAAGSFFNSAAEPFGAGERLVEIDDQAFSGSRGVVQLNQGAGVGNRMVNNLGIRMVE